ncbi:putative WRKY transcription factor [Quillaja saponaria]|uniref:WRKY transcription factor n=1 Tax=Quillaja saponaria TaxID=32244 RepID=A0AAD7LHP4_QUISA|nr:putative WRKY transcription factor [Quillaja saponaria]
MSSDNNNFKPLDSPDSDFGNQSGFEFSEYLKFDDELLDEDDPASVFPWSVQNPTYQANDVVDKVACSGREKKEVKERFVFKTKSEVEILDDGLMWKKYGKKKVKNNPNPRNYYRYSVDGCPVKNRVERDREDQRYAITTYEGNHTHQSSY